MAMGETPKLLNVNEAAERLGVSVSYLNKMRLTGAGPPFVKLGARVCYDQPDLSAWIEGQKRRSTAGLGEASS
ncbi:AlpA family transcriptional regulator [Phenylobacterium sp.]|uniref:helix-turn-helix transcriptional regulator n=1 Tax=Phenylobacterium sp. TaxID=1871053 RepID=UPI002726807C|nr:helix-turn-helix domain-containing protein [Phenylobacterium sp.]MDO8379217.1 helix-turn-helix domain-containing protein [Phenylobacterium sp.]